VFLIPKNPKPNQNKV